MQHTLAPFVILDRDGVINYDSESYIRSPEDWKPIPGSLEAIALLNRAGINVVVATNQSGIARGYYDEATLTRIHEKMTQALAKVGAKLSGVFYCPHGPEDNCFCRKPKPGLIHQIAQQFKIDVRGIPFVGDSQRDLDAAVAAGCLPVLVKTGNGEKTAKKTALPAAVYEDLMGFSTHWVGQLKKR